MSEELKRTELYQWHLEHGARLVPFAGWEMPVQYPTGPIEEHRTTRQSAGLFDIDHMGQIVITGPDAEPFLNRMVTWDIGLMAASEAHYALMCNENGGVVDDVFIYKLPARWFVVVNASNLAKDYQWLREHSEGYRVTIQDVSPETYMLALQGPQAIEILQEILPTDMDEVPRFTAVEDDIEDIPTLIGRTGYTGEDGVELFFPAIRAVELWELILRTGRSAGIDVKPIGLAARDSLRFEAGLPLYGHEISETITPLEAGLGWVCKLDKEFIGQPALAAQKEHGPARKVVAFELTEKGVPRQDYVVTTPDGQEIGRVVTGLYAPTVDKYCGHALVNSTHAAPGTDILVVIRDKPKTARVVKRPFYTPVYRR
jgi:glycine cleavage system T protein